MTTAQQLDHRATVLGMYEAFGRGDLPAILECVADEVDWALDDDSATAQLVPFLGHSGTSAEVGSKYFGGALASVDFNDFRPVAVAVDGDHVVSVIHEDVTVKATGKRVACDCVHHFTFGADGRIVRYRPLVPTEYTEAFKP